VCVLRVFGVDRRRCVAVAKEQLNKSRVIENRECVCVCFVCVCGASPEC